MIYRGIELKTSITHELRQASQVIEVYPFASKARLFGTTMPRKTATQGMSFLRDKLATMLPDLEPYLGMFDHDLGDAVIAAYTGLLYHRNKVDGLGNGKEGLILIPD